MDENFYRIKSGIGLAAQALPDSGRLGDIASDETGKIHKWNGTAWEELGTGGGGGSSSVNTQVTGTDVDWSAGDVFWKEISSNETYSFSNLTNGKTIVFAIKNTGASSITVAFPTVLTGGTLITTILPGRENVYTFIRSNNKTYGSVLPDMI